jgi:ribosomal-protein-alanine N-acetyltransferase
MPEAPDPAPDLARLHARCFTTPRPWSAAELRAFLQDPLCLALIEPQGFLIGRAVADEAELLTLAVDPDARRQGVARRLMAGFLAQARARGATSVFLEVAADNAPAIALYLASGFSRVACRRGYYRASEGPAVDALIMAQTL